MVLRMYSLEFKKEILHSGRVPLLAMSLLFIWNACHVFDPDVYPDPDLLSFSVFIMLTWCVWDDIRC